MVRYRWVAYAWIAVGWALGFSSGAEDDLRKEVELLRQQVEGLLKEKAAAKPVGPGPVDKALANKYGPGAGVSSKQGRLTIGGLLQVWYYSIQNDTRGLFGDRGNEDTALGSDSNEAKDNDSFRLRRTEVRFGIEIHENVSALIQFDPAREATSFPSFASNLGSAARGAQVTRISGSGASAQLNTASSVSNVQSGSASAGRALQDAYLNVHGLVPHHDLQIGQFKPPFGEEGLRSSAELDFVERTLFGQLGDKRDLGVQVHGTWWSERFQYWLGVFDSAGNFHGSAGDAQNRSDDNDAKDIAGRLLLRPLWNDETWGGLELGWSSQFGRHGEAGNQRADGADADTLPDGVVDGLNRARTWASRHAAWALYRPGGPARGWWLRGEWNRITDRNAPGAVSRFSGTGFIDTATQSAPHPFTVSGWYFASGYKLSESAFKDSAPSGLRPFEFTFRYETFENVTVADLVNSQTRTDVFSSAVFTAGVNYYLRGHNAKIQANYNWVREEDGHNKPERGMREVRNDNFIVAFQVAW